MNREGAHMHMDGCCGDSGGEGAPAQGANRPLTLEELRERFIVLTRLMYDTSVPLGVLDREVMPFIAPDIEFVDPLVHAFGRRLFRTGLHGFHCSFLFDFTIAQAAVQLNAQGDGGRAIVDGVMNLRSLIVYTYPLRTTLVYDFTLKGGGTSLWITRQDEIWSLGDLVRNVPALGRVYDVGRRGFGYVFAGASAVSCAIVTRLRPSFRR